MKFTNSGIKTVKLNYLLFNNGKPKNLIVHHGLLGSHKNFRNICKNQNISSYANCYLIDSRNHGQSPHTPTHSIQELATDLAKFIEQQNLMNVVLLGHSMGGMAVLKFTELFPNFQNIVKDVVIVDTSPIARPSQTLKKMHKMLKQLSEINLNQNSDNIYKQINRVTGDPAIAGLIKTNLEFKNQQFLWKSNILTLAKQYNQIENFTVQPTNWTNQVNFIYGSISEHANQNSAQQFKSIYKNFRQTNIHRVEGSGHWVHFQKPYLFLQIMKNILSKPY